MMLLSQAKEKFNITELEFRLLVADGIISRDMFTIFIKEEPRGKDAYRQIELDSQAIEIIQQFSNQKFLRENRIVNNDGLNKSLFVSSQNQMFSLRNALNDINNLVINGICPDDAIKQVTINSNFSSTQLKFFYAKRIDRLTNTDPQKNINYLLNRKKDESRFTKKPRQKAS